MTPEQEAEAVGMSEGAVRRKIHRGKTDVAHTRATSEPPTISTSSAKLEKLEKVASAEATTEPPTISTSSAKLEKLEKVRRRPKLGTQRPDKWEQLVRDPTCKHYESCLDRYAALDAEGRPMTLHSKEHPGWSCSGCRRYQYAGPMSEADVRLFLVIAAAVLREDPGTILRGEEPWRGGWRDSLPGAE